MDLKIVSAVARALTANGSNGYVRVAAGSTFKVGATVNLTSTTPLTNNGLQIQDIKGVSGSTDIALYLIDPANGQPFNATAYLTAATATITQPEQRLWYGVGTDEVPPYSPLTDVQMAAVLAAIFPAAVAPASNVSILNWPVSQPVSITSSPLPTNAATETTLASILSKLNASVAVTGTFWQATQPISAAALPLPTGAATETTLGSVLTALGSTLTVSGTVAITATQLPASLGAKTSANSLSVTTATDQFPMVDKTATGTITTIGNTVEFDSQGTGAVKFVVSGVWTGTLLMEQSVDGTNWISYGGIPLPTSLGLPATALVTANGTWLLTGSGAQKLRLRATAAMTGTATITFDGGSSPSLLFANMLDDGIFDTANNATTTPLGGNGVFTGVGKDISAFTSVSVFIYSNVPSATNGVQLQFSTDNAVWLTAYAATYTDNGMCSHIVLGRRAKYFRIIYTNGVAAQGTFQMQVIYQRVAAQTNMVGLEETIEPIQTGALTRSILTGKSAAAAGTYVNVPVLDHDNLATFATAGLAVRPVLDAYQFSAFAEQRVSIPYTLADIVQKYGRNARLIASALVGGGNIADTLNMSGFTLSVDGVAASQARARTSEWYRYQTGRGQQILQTIIHGNAGVANQTRNWGYYDDSDGLMYRLVGTTLNVVRRTSTGESGGTLVAPYEQIVAQSAWNVDKLDGSGNGGNPSGVLLDITKGSIYEIRFQWLGVGVVQFFINTHLVHQMIHPNTLAFPYMRTGTLPLSWSVLNDATASAGSMTVICGHVTSESGEVPPHIPTTATRAPLATASAAETPLISLRLKTLLNTLDNRITVTPTSLGLSESAGNRSYVFIRLNPTLTGATFAVATEATSGIEVDTAATAVATPGTLVARFALNANNDISIDLAKYFALGSRVLRREAYTGVSDILTVSIQRVAAQNPTVDCALAWDEYQ